MEWQPSGGLQTAKAELEQLVLTVSKVPALPKTAEKAQAGAAAEEEQLKKTTAPIPP